MRKFKEITDKWLLLDGNTYYPQTNAVHMLISSVFAGICIGLGGYAYLSVGGVVGAVIFSFGLLSVIAYGLHLFTGKSGFYNNYEDILCMFTIILIGNAIGCYLMSLIASDAVISGATAIVQARLSASVFDNFLLAIPCGFIMTTAVKFAKDDKNYLPLLFGVPLFIVCGFRHCIADIFYYLVSGTSVQSWFVIWIVCIIGNYIGCNIHRLLKLFK